MISRVALNQEAAFVEPSSLGPFVDCLARPVVDTRELGCRNPERWMGWRRFRLHRYKANLKGGRVLVLYLVVSKGGNQLGPNLATC